MNWLRGPSALAIVCALFAVLPAAAALADASIDAATKASQVNQEECANVHTLKQSVSAVGVQKVAEVWAEVGKVYELQGKAPYLLFWRGVLAQCLGRDELATLDLESFVASQKGQTMFVDLVRQARIRMKRLGGRARAGEGPSAMWLRRDDVLEVDFSYGLATGLRGLACSDEGGASLSEILPGEEARPANSSCLGGAGFQLPTGDTRMAPMEGVGPPFWPVGLRLGLGGFPLRFLGVGAVLLLDQNLQSESLETHAPGPVVQVLVGPQLRFLSSVSSGRRAGELRIAPRFAVAWGGTNPWSGSKDVSGFSFLDAGLLSTRHLGVQLEVTAKFEVSPRVVLKVSGEAAYYLPAEADAVTRSIQSGSVSRIWDPDNGGITVEERVEIFPPLLQAMRFYGAGRVALLLPHPKVNLAVGPFFEVAFHSTHLVYPNLSGDEWDARSVVVKRLGTVGKPARELLDVLGESAADSYMRKVYSTRRQDLLFRIGVELHFGVGSLTKKPK
jgi:hypothetical protein